MFTGTPSGVSKIQPNDVLTGFMAGEENFKIKIK
ncbi:MAG: 2-keto-4-pentenoate hydratase/2-oxohepta-3-ene-1,7-dioic acid hydratase in catechol pathway [Patiriisocius sp.]